MKKWTSEIVTGSIAGIVGSLITVSIVLWIRLPDHTIDLLAFSESAFGIGMTVIALFFSLITVNQSKELTRIFDEKSKDYDARFNRSMTTIANFIDKMPISAEDKAQLDRAVASMSVAGFDQMTPPSVTTANLPIPKGPHRGGHGAMP